jgi:subtilisin family serine protease
MHIYTANREPIELEHLPSAFIPAEPAPLLHVSARNAPPLLSDATRTFFRMNAPTGVALKGQQEGTVAGPPPAVFREVRSGLMRIVHREIVIRFRNGTSDKLQKQILAKHDLKVRARNRYVGTQVVAYDATEQRQGAQLVEIANDCSSMPEVVFATPNFVSEFRRKAVQIPKIHAEQWHLRNTGAAGQHAGEDVDAIGAWKITMGRGTITVAVLDDGVDVEHPHLKRNIRRKPDATEPRDLVGRDFFVPDDESPEHFDPRPKRFKYPYDVMTGNDIHGTPCAGVIAATGLNGASCGIAPKCRILPVKVFHADDLAADSRVADAIRYAALHADILSCSWTGPRSTDIELALQDARTLGRGGRGATVFAAAGNGSGRPVGYPASDPLAIAVGASTDQAALAGYSNVGPEVWVVAPSSGGVRGIYCTDVSVEHRGFNVGTVAAGGVDGLSTNDFGGTSSATPLVAGVAALMLSANAKLDVEGVKGVLKDTAEKIGGGYDANGHSQRFGFGRVHAGRAVALARDLGTT